MKLTTRSRILTVTTISTLLFMVLERVTDFRILFDLNLNFDPFKPLVLAIAVYIGSFWLLHFKVSGERYLTILLFPAISVFAIALFSEFVIVGILSSIGQLGVLLVAAALFWVLTYLILLTVNILNVAYMHEIPLGQAGRAAHFILTLLIAYISYFLLFSNDIYIIIRIGLISIITWLLVYISLWTIKLRRKRRALASFDIALFLTFAAIILSAWPIAAPYLALTLTLLLYVTLGIALEIREVISRWIWIEYLSLFVLILIMLAIVARWGINGSLI